MSALRAYVASQTTVLHMKRLNQTESLIFVGDGGIIEPILVALKIEYRLSLYTRGSMQPRKVHMKRLYKTKFPVFVFLCVLCFQMQPFRLLSKQIHCK